MDLLVVSEFLSDNVMTASLLKDQAVIFRVRPPVHDPDVSAQLPAEEIILDLPHKNIQVFKLLLNKMPFNRICEAAGISIPTLYDKINFLHRQCQAFAASREGNLADTVKAKKIYIAVVRQDYMVNWNRRKDKRNIVLHATGSADNATG